jgi:hypothetical protein
MLASTIRGTCRTSTRPGASAAAAPLPLAAPRAAAAPPRRAARLCPLRSVADSAKDAAAAKADVKDSKAAAEALVNAEASAAAVPYIANSFGSGRIGSVSDDGGLAGPFS